MDYLIDSLWKVKEVREKPDTNDFEKSLVNGDLVEVSADITKYGKRTRLKNNRSGQYIFTYLEPTVYLKNVVFDHE